MKRKMNNKQKFWFVMFCIAELVLLIGCYNMATWGNNEQWGLLGATTLLPFFVICRSIKELI
mgnify:CR=1 FL=1|jgi:hypothetical protein